MTRKLLGLSAAWVHKPLLAFMNWLLRKSAYFGDCDNDSFPEIVIDSVPVPYFISDTKKLAVARSMLIARTRKLINFGANIMAIACNTAHLMFSDLSSIPGASFISMIDAVVDRAVNQKIKRIGILATPTTIKLGLYQNKLHTYNIETFVLPMLDQKKYEQVIRSVVAGNTSPRQIDYLFRSVTDFISQHDLEAIILGCTELPLVFPKERFKISVFDSLDILAESLININVKI